MSTFQRAGDASALFANAGASPALKPAAGCTSICSGGPGTPGCGLPKQLTLALAADEPVLFQRQVSSASTEYTGSTDFHRFTSEEDATPFASPFVGSQRWGSKELPEWHLQDACHPDPDGTKWIVAEGGCPFVEALEESLDDLKALYQKKFGLDVDEEVQDEGLLEDADGTKWQVTEGRGVLTGLEDRLQDLKALYQRKYGLDVDDEEEDESLFEDTDGTKWQVTEGSGLLTGLEARLEDLKAMYKRKYGLDVDEEEDESLCEDADGIKWQVTEGRGLLTLSEDRLADLKALYKR
jgi:hypothetical protein